MFTNNFAPKTNTRSNGSKSGSSRAMLAYDACLGGWVRGTQQILSPTKKEDVSWRIAFWLYVTQFNDAAIEQGHAAFSRRELGAHLSQWKNNPSPKDWAALVRDAHRKLSGWIEDPASIPNSLFGTIRYFNEGGNSLVDGSKGGDTAYAIETPDSVTDDIKQGFAAVLADNLCDVDEAVNNWPFGE